MQQQFVRITNTSSVGCWIANKFLEPNYFVTIDIVELPPNWQTLKTMFRFDFLEPTPLVSAVASATATVDPEQLKNAVREVLAERELDLKSLAKDLAGHLQPHIGIANGNGTSNGIGTPKSTATRGIEQAVFIPDENLKAVDDKSIEITEEVRTGESTASVKEKLTAARKKRKQS